MFAAYRTKEKCAGRKAHSEVRIELLESHNAKFYLFAFRGHISMENGSHSTHLVAPLDFDTNTSGLYIEREITHSYIHVVIK